MRALRFVTVSGASCAFPPADFDEDSQRSRGKLLEMAQSFHLESFLPPSFAFPSLGAGLRRFQAAVLASLAPLMGGSPKISLYI